MLSDVSSVFPTFNLQGLLTRNRLPVLTIRIIVIRLVVSKLCLEVGLPLIALMQKRVNASHPFFVRVWVWPRKAWNRTESTAIGKVFCKIAGDALKLCPFWELVQNLSIVVSSYSISAACWKALHRACSKLSTLARISTILVVVKGDSQGFWSSANYGTEKEIIGFAPKTIKVQTIEGKSDARSRNA